MDGAEPRALRADEANANLKTLLLSVKLGVENHENRTKLLDLLRRTKLQIDAFEQLPKLLDPQLQWYVDTISTIYMLMKLQNSVLCEQLAELVYVLCKVRGYKVVSTYFSNDVYLIQKVMAVLGSDDISDFEAYLNLLWLSTLVLVPFPLSTIKPNLEKDIAGLALQFMATKANASKCQLMSLVCLANLLTRPDSSHILLDYVETASLEWSSMALNSKLGHLMALNQILKRFSGSNVQLLAEIIHSKIIQNDIAQLKHNTNTQVTSIHVLYLIKVSSKVARIAVNNGNYSIAACVVNNYIQDLMGSFGDRFDANLREATAKNLARIVSYLNLKATNYADQLVWFVIDQLRLPQLTSTSGFIEVLEITSENLSVARYHTVLLFLGFLALSKSVSVRFVPTILSVFHSTCALSKRKFLFVQGSHIRDAACFCAWAVMRMLKSNEFEELGKTYPKLWNVVFGDILRVIIFDEDFTLRRCGIAVLQEFIGRFGSLYLKTVFPSRDGNKIGELTLHFVELFNSSSVSSCDQAHNLIIDLLGLGILDDVFYSPLLEEITNEEMPFALRKLGGRYFSKIVATVQSNTEVNSSRYINTIIGQLMKGDYLSIYALAELLASGLLAGHQIDLVSNEIALIKFDHHFDGASKAESLLHWYISSLGKHNKTLPFQESNILSMSRLTATDELANEFALYFELVTSRQLQSISADQIFHYLKNGNATLAKTATAYLLSQNGLDPILELVANTRVDADARSEIIKSLSSEHYLFEVNDSESALSKTILDLLDDYTLTNQGDVGLKIRGACLKLLEGNKGFACGLGHQLECKLLRLAGEPMDKLRVQAFLLLCQIRKIDCYAEHRDVYMSDYHAYFGDLMHFYKRFANDESRTSFWSGIVHTSGALTGNNLIINISFRQVLTATHESDEAEELLLHLTRLLRTPPDVKVSELNQRIKKTLLVTLNFLGKLFDSGIEPSTDFNFTALFVRAYNLHINTNDATRIQLAVRIFQYIGTWHTTPADLRRKCWNRLCWLTCCHASERIRGASGDCLFEIVNEIDPASSICDFIETAKVGRQPKSVLQKLEQGFPGT